MIWESYVTLFSDVEPSFKLLGPARQYEKADKRLGEWTRLDYAKALEADIFPLPETDNREGYYGEDHFSYWASGLLDAQLLVDAAGKHGCEPTAYLDFGCASGRVLRHFPTKWPRISALGCDINRLHVEWCNSNLPRGCVVFQNNSIPSLPLADMSVDIVSAYSVFTHIEAMETSWLMEIRRILKPGGIAWITVHSELTLQDMTPEWPLWEPVWEHPDSAQKLDAKRQFASDRLVLRWHGERSYSSNTFYKLDYLQRHWSRIMPIVELRRRCPSFQDVLIMQKQ